MTLPKYNIGETVIFAFNDSLEVGIIDGIDFDEDCGLYVYHITENYDDGYPLTIHEDRMDDPMIRDYVARVMFEPIIRLRRL